MGMIKDFRCTYDNSENINEEIIKSLNLILPDTYLHRDSMVLLSKAVKEKNGSIFCKLPFCHTVEAEALGGMINYGDEKAGPRAKDYIYTKVEELLMLPAIDFKKGRIYEVLLACKSLINQGEHVILEVSGPFTILNTLIDIKYIFKGLRKQPEFMKKIFWKIGTEILQFMKEAEKYGVDMISYADSSGGLNILGPVMAEQVMNDFTYDFLNRVEQELQDNTLVLLCPKTTYTLLGMNRAKFEKIALSERMSYGEACVQVRGKVRFVGETCIKNIGYKLENGILKSVKLL